ncbi:MAG: hypothetical protein FWG60_00450, partial [Methanomassiliicoccaceae archaeon]|nr:hypothetical protein [Methanomassiliicoccaceae archaeon]
GGGPVILTIDIVGGDGGVDISIDGGPYQPYDGPVPIPYDCTLGLVIHPKEGYELSEWRIGDDVFTTPEQTINNVRSSLQLELFFIKVDDSGVMCWIIPILLLILLAGILLWFILFYKKRRYDVYIQEFSLITGDDSVRRKRAYTFTAGEGYSGTVSYRIGEDGTWKLLFRNEDGTYTVPKNEVVGDIYLETRP